MMDEKRLEQEYREMKRQAAPDLWSRIEEGLKVHPERQMTIKRQLDELPEETFNTAKRNRSRFCGMAAAAAAMLALMVVFPRMSGEKTSESEGAAWDRAQESAKEETEMLLEKEAEPGAGMLFGTTGKEDAADAGGEAQRAMGASLSSREVQLPDGVVDYGQLSLAAYQPVAVPENAVTIPEDTQYFSEAVLRDAQLLCGGTVKSVSFEEDASGKAVKVVYELILDQVYYAEDYITGVDRIFVKSPIIKTDGDEMYILYQLQPEGTYLLPLCKNDGEWELLYPFAPQIQVTGDGAYLFHSGYSSLVNDSTSVVIGSQEGRNDYYYDRMVLRKDAEFLSELLALVDH